MQQKLSIAASALKILALDPATLCGWATFDGTKKILYGSVNFHNKQWDGAGMRFLEMQRFIMTTHHEHELELVVYEAVENHGEGGVYAAHVYGGFSTHIQSFCERIKIPYKGFGVSEIKKFWTGKGNASKTMMMSEARHRGFNPADDNAADALAILHLAMDRYCWN